MELLFQFIAEEYDRLGTNAFWKKFSNGDGKRLSFQKILDCLKAERKLRDQQDHDEVKQIFGKP